MTAPTRYAGEVVYIYDFDVAYEMTRRPVTQLLGQPVATFAVDASKRSPRQPFFYRPQMVRLPPLERIGPGGALRLERTVKILPVGAISITVRVPFEAGGLEELVAYHDLRFNDGVFLYDEVRRLAEEARWELAPHFIRPVEQLADEEAYTVFCLDAERCGFGDAASGKSGAQTWMMDNRRQIAAILTEELHGEQLSQQEAEESTSRFYSYYEQDLAVVDWDAALIVDERRYFEELLHIMELANLQLAELEAYDRILDSAVDRSYRDLSFRRLGQRGQGGVERQLREIRLDFARLSDELSNITKFLGDWHLARIYQALSSRFHLSDWHRTIDEKLKTLDDLYQLLRHDQTNRWMLILETTIVLLFILDLIMLAYGK